MNRRATTSIATIALALIAVACSAAPSRSSSSGLTTPGTNEVTRPAPAVEGVSTLTPIIVSVLAAPIPVPATDGRIHLAYELVLTNTLSQPVTITRIRALDGDRALDDLSADELPAWMKVYGTSTPTATFGAGQSGLVWIDATVADEADIPNAIDHVIGLSVAQPDPPLLPATLDETVARTTVRHQDPIVIEPPLRGDNWLDGNSCCTVTPHRAAVSPLNGALWAPERYAIDYVQLQRDGRLYTGDKTKLESYPYVGAPIHAVAAGRIVAVADGRPEQPPGANPTGLTLDEYGGNYVVQDIGDGRYAFYAHLQPGSIRSKVGDEVGSGDVVALLGNSGNSDSPHLHFHLMDGPDPLAANGLPFVFTSFTRTGVVADDAAINDLIDTGGPAKLEPGVTSTPEHEVMPLYRDLMSY
jgi:hypothetical protein